MKIKVIESTPKQVKKLIYSVLNILKNVGVSVKDTDRRLERMAKACLAVGCIKTSIGDARSIEDGICLRTRDIIGFENKYYGENMSPGSYDDIRRLDLRHLIEKGVVVSSSSEEKQSTNNPSRGYGLSRPFCDLLKYYGTPSWEYAIFVFLEERERMVKLQEERISLISVPVTLPNGDEIKLSYGKHNDLQKSIIEVFLPIFGLGASVLYVGDTTDKFLYKNEMKLKEIGCFDLEHEELPDIIAYSEEKNLLFLIEAYHSTGEWNDVRVNKIKRKLKDYGCIANIVFFTAFENKTAFRQKAKDIAWETEVWIADSPEHLVHFNGYKFLEVYK